MAGNGIDEKITVLYQRFEKKQKETKKENRSYIEQQAFRDSLKDIFKKSGLENESEFLDNISKEIDNENLYITPEGHIEMNSDAINRVIGTTRQKEIDEYNKNNAVKNRMTTAEAIANTIISYEVFAAMTQEKKVEYFAEKLSGLFGSREEAKEFSDMILNFDWKRNKEEYLRNKRVAEGKGSQEDYDIVGEEVAREYHKALEFQKDIENKQSIYTDSTLLTILALNREDLKSFSSGSNIYRAERIAKSNMLLKTFSTQVLAEYFDDYLPEEFTSEEDRFVFLERMGKLVSIDRDLSGKSEEEIRKLVLDCLGEPIADGDLKKFERIIRDIQDNGKFFKMTKRANLAKQIKQAIQEKGEIKLNNEELTEDFLFEYDDFLKSKEGRELVGTYDNKIKSLEKSIMVGDYYEGNNDDYFAITSDIYENNSFLKKYVNSFIPVKKDSFEEKKSEKHSEEQTSPKKPLTNDYYSTPSYDSSEVIFDDFILSGAANDYMDTYAVSYEEPPITSGPPDNAASIIDNLAEDLQFGGSEPEMEVPQAEAPENDVLVEEPGREEVPEVKVETELESEEPPISGSEPIDTSNLHAETIVMEEEPIPEIPVADKPEYEGPVSSDLAMVEEKPKGLFGKLGAFAKAVFDRSDKRSLSDKWNRIFHNNKEFYTDETSTSNNASDGGKKGNETPTEEQFKQEQMQKQTGLEYDPVAAAKIEAVRNNAAKDNKNGANRSEANEKRQDDSERDDTH